MGLGEGVSLQNHSKRGSHTHVYPAICVLCISSVPAKVRVVSIDQKKEENVFRQTLASKAHAD